MMKDAYKKYEGQGRNLLKYTMMSYMDDPKGFSDWKLIRNWLMKDVLVHIEPRCRSIKSYEHIRFKKHCIKELRTVLKCQKVFVNDIILRPLGFRRYLYQCIISKKKSYSKVCNTERIVKLFRLEATLQSSV